MAKISTEGAKKYLRVDHTGDDSSIAVMVTAAESYIRSLCKPFVDEDGYNEELPPEVEQAVLLLTSHFYDNRGLFSERGRGEVAELPFAVSALIANHRDQSA